MLAWINQHIVGNDKGTKCTKSNKYRELTFTVWFWKSRVWLLMLAFIKNSIYMVGNNKEQTAQNQTNIGKTTLTVFVNEILDSY